MDQGDGQASMFPVDWDLDWSLLEDGEDFSGRPHRLTTLPAGHALTCDGPVELEGATTQQASFVAPTDSTDTFFDFDGGSVFDQHHEHSWTLSPGQAPSDLEGVWNQAQWPLAPQSPWGPPLPEYGFAMTDSLPVSHNEPDQGGSQDASLVPASFGTSFLEANHTRVKPGNVPLRELLPAKPDPHSFSQMKEPISFETRARYMDLHSTAKTRKTASRPKPRLPCTFSGCPETFPRPYELKRHVNTVHQRQTQILCSVFECDRNSNPIPRVDKFFEHIRKAHSAADSFLCIVESCRKGPFFRDELIQHLAAQHPLETLDQPCLEESLNALNHGGPERLGLKILVDISSCPLRILGCDFLASPRKNGMRRMREHVRGHDLLERSKGYKSIVQMFGDWGHSGVAKCPICKKGICKRQDYVGNFIYHLFNKHDKESRRIHALELQQVLRPFVTGKENFSHFGRDGLIKLIAEFREAGVI